MLEKWQEALRHWDAWVESIKQTKAFLQDRHGDLSQLLSHSEIVWPEDEDGSSGVSLKPETNKEALILWNLYDEVEEIGSTFILNKIGLKPGLELHKVFLNHWVHLVIPELTEDYDPKYYLQEYMAEYLVKKEKTYFWHFSKPTKWLGNDEIIDSIHWCRGKINTREIVAKLKEIKWPSSSQVRMERDSDRRSEQDRINTEAIVCAILKDKQG